MASAQDQIIVDKLTSSHSLIIATVSCMCGQPTHSVMIILKRYTVLNFLRKHSPEHIQCIQRPTTAISYANLRGDERNKTLFTVLTTK